MNIEFMAQFTAERNHDTSVELAAYLGSEQVIVSVNQTLEITGSGDAEGKI